MAGRKMTPKGQMAFGGGPPITHLPPAMKAMFQPGPPLPFKEKITKKKCPPFTGIGSLMSMFESGEPPARILQKTPRQIKEKAQKEKMKRNAEILEAEISEWDPTTPRDEAKDVTTGDAYKTLFVSRLSYDTTEKKLRREFEQFGDIKSIRVVHVEAASGKKKKKDEDKDATMEDDEPASSDDENPKLGKPRGYAFIEFEKEADMRAAYKRADGRKIDTRRVLVDVERGRTVRNWKPRRLGGGLGTTRKSAVAPTVSRGPTGTVLSTTRAPARVVTEPSSLPASWGKTESSKRARSPERDRKSSRPKRSRSRDRSRRSSRSRERTRR